MKTQRPLALLPLALLLMYAVVLAKPKSTAKPGYVKLSVAGVRLDVKQGNYTKFDAKAGYYLDVSNDLDEITLFLCPSLKRMEEAANGRMIRGTLPRLRSGAGVNIGDTPLQVQRKLGAPPVRSSFDRKVRERNYTYTASISERLLGGSSSRTWAYRADYIFHNEQLWAIQYTATDARLKG